MKYTQGPQYKHDDPFKAAARMHDDLFQELFTLKELLETGKFSR